jgi:hypothetical protein
MLSLFQMSELRKQKKLQDKKYKKALGILIETHHIISSDVNVVVNSLDLHGQNLASCHLFFDNFLLLSDLTVLHLDHNLLNCIPNGILKSLPLLQDLALHNNQLEALPAEIGALTRLQHLRLDCNALTSLPRELKCCSSLLSLHLSGNPALSSLPDDLFEDMPLLHHVLAAQCPQLRALPTSLQHCPVLSFVETDDTVLQPPAAVLAGGYQSIRQYFQSDSLADTEKEQTQHTQFNSPSMLESDTHHKHRDNALRYLELKRGARMTGTGRCDSYILLM